jgi:hypothetical protein
MVPKEVHIIRVAVASPSDVKRERDSLSAAIDEINAWLARAYDVRLELWRWETDAFPAFHPQGPQGTIDEILKINDCDILVGIFWRRFGTPTIDADSGTEHEFRVAYRGWKTRGRPQILVYFNEQPYNPGSKEETDQWGRVLQFKQNFPKEGLWWPYRGHREFEPLVRRHLTNYLNQTASKPITSMSGARQSPPVELPDGVNIPALDLLPIDARNPLLLGIAADVSGSMQELMDSQAQENTSRLENVFYALRDLTRTNLKSAGPAEYEGLLDLVKVFAYGFGFSDRANDFGELATFAKAFMPNLPPVPAHRYPGKVRDLFEIAGLPTTAITLRNLADRWSDFETGIWDQRIDLFGDTPMREAVQVIAGRFEDEFRAYPGVPHSLLLIISDGKSTDGSPLEYCRQLEGRGTVIMSCYLTNADITEPKTLYAQPQPAWPEEACLLFECAAKIGEQASVLSSFQIKGWRVESGDRLFVKLNQSEHLNEFLSFALDLASAGERPLG